MGSGASTKHQGSGMPPGNTDKDLRGSTDMVEGSVHWLFSIVDKEKREKEWLAAKYDEQTAQVRALQKEVAELRRELNACRASSSSNTGEDRERVRTPMRGMAPDVIAKVPGDAVAVSTPGKSSAILADLQDQTSPVSPSGAGKLKERRGLRTLSIETPIRARAAPDAIQTQKVESKDKEEQPPASGEACVLAAAVSVNPCTSTAVLGPRDVNAERKTGSRLVAHEGGEPGSALLRRRKEDWQIMETVLEKADSPKLSDLQIKASKVLDLDCPASPKRPGRRRGDF